MSEEKKTANVTLDLDELIKLALNRVKLVAIEAAESYLTKKVNKAVSILNKI